METQMKNKFEFSSSSYICCDMEIKTSIPNSQVLCKAKNNYIYVILYASVLAPYLIFHCDTVLPLWAL